MILSVILFCMLGKSKKNIVPIIFSCIFYIGVIFFNQNLIKPEILINKQESAINFNKDFLKFISIGNKRFFSDLIWVQTLLESDESHYKKNDLNSWMFVRFYSISELDPFFYQNYLWGGIYLSIVKDDRLGAAKIFEKGLKHYPDDYGLNYNAAFNYYAQLENYKRAYELLSKIQYYPQAPYFLRTLVAKIQFQTSFDYDETINLLKRYLDETKDELLIDKIKKNIYAVKAERDIKCLNEKSAKCDSKDAYGNSYLYKNGKYDSVEKYLPYRINLNNGSRN